MGKLNNIQIINILQPILGTGERILHQKEIQIMQMSNMYLHHKYLQSIDFERISSESSCNRIYDFRNIFDKTDTEQIYFDEGHMSDLGNEIIANEIYRKIVNSDICYDSEHKICFSNTNLQD